MKYDVYGMLAAAPVDFPNEVELRVYPHDKDTGLGYPGCYTDHEHRSWEWVRKFVPLVPYAWPEIEERLRAGECTALHLGVHTIDLPDGSDGPGIVQGRA